MAAVTITCICGRQFTLDTALAGTSFPCPTCNRLNKVPSEHFSAAPRQMAARPEPLATTIAATPQPRESPKSRRRTPVWMYVAAAGLIAIALIVLVPMGIERYHEHRVTKLEKEQRGLPQQRQQRQAELEKQVRDS